LYGQSDRSLVGVSLLFFRRSLQILHVFAALLQWHPVLIDPSGGCTVFGGVVLRGILLGIAILEGVTPLISVATTLL
jgi:hypothetical protein